MPSSWLSLLRNHLQVSWAIDFFTVTTVGFGRLYVFVVLEHGRRRVIHWATGQDLVSATVAVAFSEEPTTAG
jgi:hypothetical protein